MNYEEILQRVNDGTIIGRHENIPDEVYHDKRIGLSRSVLGKIDKSIDHMFVNEEMTPTKRYNLDLGNAIHTRCLEPHLFDSKYYANGLDKRTKDYKELVIKNEGKIALKPKDMDMISSIYSRYKDHPFVKENIDKDSNFENTYFFQKKNVLMKFRPDVASPNQRMMIDLKSTIDAYSFPKSVFNFKYDYQTGFYMTGMEILNYDYKDFVFLAVEKEPPFKIKPWYMPESGIELGKEIFEIYLSKYVRSTSRNYLSRKYKDDELPEMIDYPQWALDISKRINEI
jgi:exodeoxyribonuclease VIII